MTFKSILIGGSIAAIGLAAWAGPNDKSYDLSGFDKIDISGVYELEVTVGEDFSVDLSGDPEDLERAIIEQRGDTLYMKTKSDRRNWRDKDDDYDSVVARITLPRLSELDVSGVVDGDISGFSGGRIKIDLSGVADLELSGTCDSLDADVSGVGELEAEDLKCKDVEINLSGVGEASVYASESIDARVSGMGEVDVYGRPAVVKKSDSLFSEVTIK